MRLCKSIVVSTIISFIFYLVFAGIVNAMFENVEERTTRFFILYCFMMLVYAACFYFIHIKKREELFAPDEKFHLITEAKHYFFTEGKYLLLIYSVLAVLCEIDALIPSDSPGKLIVTLCSMFFPFFTSIKIPVIRALINLLLANVIPLILVEIHSFKLHRRRQL